MCTTEQCYTVEECYIDMARIRNVKKCSTLLCDSLCRCWTPNVTMLTHTQAESYLCPHPFTHPVELWHRHRVARWWKGRLTGVSTLLEICVWGRYTCNTRKWYINEYHIVLQVLYYIVYSVYKRARKSIDFLCVCQLCFIQITAHTIRESLVHILCRKIRTSSHYCLLSCIGQNCCALWLLTREKCPCRGSNPRPIQTRTAVLRLEWLVNII